MASRVVVMTAGPGRTASEDRVDAPMPRPAGFRTSELFRRAAEKASADLATAMAATA